MPSIYTCTSNEAVEYSNIHKAQVRVSEMLYLNNMSLSTKTNNIKLKHLHFQEKSKIESKTYLWCVW